MSRADFEDAVLGLAIMLGVAACFAALVLVLWAGEPRAPFVERANQACIDHHGVRSADAKFGIVVCRDGWAVKP